MDAPSDSSRGWTIAEAIDRTSDLPCPSIPAKGKERVEASHKISLRDRLLKRQLVATGRFETPSASPTAVDPEILQSLDWSGSSSSTLSGTAGSDVQIFDVRVFPVLRAPNAASLLDGLSLAEAFRRYVLLDPEVVALAQRLSGTDARHSTVFLEGQAPGPFVDYHWQLGLDARALASRFVSSLLQFVGDPITEPSAAIYRVSEVLVDRLVGLREILASGDVVALGTFEATGQETPIGRQQWQRDGISIEVRNGDLCESDDPRAIAKWSGLSLQFPNVATRLDSLQIPTPTKPAETPRRATAHIQRKLKSFAECVAWLEEKMRASPNFRTAPKAQLRAEAQTKWPGKFGTRGFDAAWAQAVGQAEAPAWSAAGRTKKSSHP